MKGITDMKTLDIAKRAGRNLRQAKGRTILTALAISVGAFTLTLSLAIGAGTRDYFAKVMETNINAQALLITNDKNLLTMAGGSSSGLREYDPTAASFGGNVTFKTLGLEDIDKISNDKGIKEISPNYQVEAQYFIIQGLDKKFSSAVATYDKTIRNEAAAGYLPRLGEMIGDDEIVLPEAYLDTLNIKEAKDAIGKTVTIHLERPMRQLSEDEIQTILSTEGFEGLENATKTESRDIDFKTVAVAAKPATALASNDQLAISSKKAKELSEYMTKGTNSYQRYVAARAIVKDGVDPVKVRDRLTEEGFSTMTAKDLQTMLFTLVNIMQSIVAGFGVLALLASVFGIINTQYISVLERTSQIGLMKAVGMSNSAVGKLFRYEAAWIGFFGGIIGSGLAIALGSIFNPIITEKLKLGAGNNLLIFQPLAIAILIIFLVFIAIVAGWFPSRKASRLDPIEALRTE